MRWLVVQKGDNPSTAFYLTNLGSADEISILNLSAPPPAVKATEDFCVVFVRYLTSEWRRWVKRNRHQIKQLCYFMDDDLLQSDVTKGLSLRYRARLHRSASRYGNWLKSQHAELWVSTAYLASKYSDWNPKIILPNNPYQESCRPITVFYHGSSSHEAEIEWLLPVVREVLAQDSSIHFEFIGDKRLRSRFAGLSRVTVVHSMDWPTYKSFVSRPGRHIGLAPLLESSFNAARSETKFFDITQAGAVGLYPVGSVYENRVSDDINGVLLPMEQHAWVAAILALAADPERRARLILGAKASL